MLHNVRINLSVETKDKRFKLLKFDEKRRNEKLFPSHGMLETIFNELEEEQNQK